ncbi:hypothetical protein PENTCL1PPCAC_11770, partial [Pristionchus entomophagus]
FLIQLQRSSIMVLSFFDSPFYSMQDEPMVVFIDDLPHKRRCPSTQTPRITQTQKKEIVKQEVNEPMKISLHIGNFNPEGIKVSLSGRSLTVEGSHSSSSDSSSFSSSFKKNDHSER